MPIVINITQSRPECNVKLEESTIIHLVSGYGMIRDTGIHSICGAESQYLTRIQLGAVR